ncbi:hypothetical protein ACFWVC_00605 [Streptomyces sp. NPDC058691]|uniref:hypothetical protein n=1 Tax=Streptomyces sp. NPDC058691 TaxID=3346601 RepID=UPI00365DB969
MIHRIALSTFGVVVSLGLLAIGIRDCRSGASVLWPAGAAAIFLAATFTLVRDVRDARRPAR